MMSLTGLIPFSLAGLSDIKLTREEYGFIYAVEFENGKIKIGKTSNPFERISTHTRTFGAMSDILGVYVSQEHFNYSENETKLLKVMGFYKNEVGDKTIAEVRAAADGLEFIWEDTLSYEKRHITKSKRADILEEGLMRKFKSNPASIDVFTALRDLATTDVYDHEEMVVYTEAASLLAKRMCLANHTHDKLLFKDLSFNTRHSCYVEVSGILADILGLPKKDVQALASSYCLKNEPLDEHMRLEA